MNNSFVFLVSCLLACAQVFALPIQGQEMPSKADKQFEMGMYAEAADEYARMIDEGKVDDVRYYEQLAQCYSNINKPFDAVATYEEAAMKFDMSADSYMHWAADLKKIGRNEEANEIISFASIKGNVEFDALDISDVVAYEIVSAPFNSSGNEFAPTYFGDDIICVTDNYNSLQVTSVSTAINELPHVLMRVDPKTGKKARLRGKLKDYINDGPSSYSADQSVVCFSKGHFPAAQSPKIGNKQSGSIYYAEADNQGDWDVMISLPCNELGTANIYPFVQADGQRVYFASNRAGGFGGFDIYYTDRIGDGWTSPKNMGDKINTTGDEISPSVDGNLLYFASNAMSGFGGYDLFQFDMDSEYAPVNMGAGVNTSWDDYALITRDQGKSGYFTSNRTGGAGGEDIYAFNRSIGTVAAQPKPAVNASAKSTTFNTTSSASAKPTASYNTTSTASAKPRLVSLNTSTASAKSTYTTSTDIPTFRVADANTDPAKIKTVYTVQVAALRQDNGSYRKVATDLGDIGFVYKVFYHDVVKIRVGQFDTESQARTALSKIKARGYGDAFVVKEELIRENYKQTQSHTTSHVDVTNAPADAGVTAQTRTQAPEIPADKIDKALENMTRYRIKLGSYTDVAAFDDSVVKRFGSVFKEEDGDWTKVYLGDYMTIEDAEAIRMEVQRAGFTSAIIYGIRDDQLIRIK